MPHVIPVMLEETQDISGTDLRVVMSPSPEQIREVVEFTAGLRETDDPFDVIASGITWGLDAGAAGDRLKSYRDAGANWWFEWLDCGRPGTLDQVREQIKAGPPGA